MWSLFSLILRTKPLERLEHIIVGINGPDNRTGDPKLQDEKQAMLEELRSNSWLHWKSGLPVTVQRTWSRLGHGEALDAAIPWVHTDEYLLLHDDIILLDSNWLGRLSGHSDPTVCASCVSSLLNGKLNFSRYPKRDSETYHLGFPHLNTSFMLCKKAEMKAANITWRGYHVEKEVFMTRDEIQSLAALYPGEVSTIPVDGVPVHFRGISWGTPEATENRLLQFKNTIIALEEEINASPFADFYRKWK
jgi:hypothetical protein